MGIVRFGELLFPDSLDESNVYLVVNVIPIGQSWRIIFFNHREILSQIEGVELFASSSISWQERGKMVFVICKQ